MNPAAFQRVSVPNGSDADQAMVSYVTQGFVVVHRTADLILLHRKKEFKIVWAVIGLVLCILPFLIYLVVYALQPDVEVVEIRIAKPATTPT